MGQKESPKPNLHVCGEDGTQRVVYKLKEEHAKEGSKQKKKKEKHRLEKENVKKEKELYRLPKQNDRCTSSKPSIYVRVNLFIPQKLI